MKALVIIKHGSYLDVYDRVNNDQKEYYHAEIFWHEFVEKLSLNYNVTIISINSNAHNVLLPNGIRSIGVDLYKGFISRIMSYIGIAHYMSGLDPVYVIIRNPESALLLLSLLHSKAVLPMFADSFNGVGLKALVRTKLLKFALNRKKISYVSNHNIAACLSLSSLGVRKEKIVPWDWYYSKDNDCPVKRLTNRESATKLIYVGKVTCGKGVGDIIEAIKYIGNDKVLVTIAGEGKDLNQFRVKAKEYGLEQNVTFLGKVENSRVIELMRSHDIVIVPSRKKEAEGLPITIYEALTSRTPIICSNHPMFVFYLIDGVSASIFEEGDYVSLAEKIMQLARSPTTYEAISANSHRSLEAMICPVKIDEIILNWLQMNDEWFKDKTLKALCAEGGGS